jgi:adenine-specific DNA-methyltransferase
MWFKSATPPNLSYKVKRNLEYVLCYEKSFNKIKFQGVQKSSPSNDPLTKPQNSLKKLTFPKGTIQFSEKEAVYKKGVYGTSKFPNMLLDDLFVKDGLNENDVSFSNKFIWIQETLDKNIADGVRFYGSKNLVLAYKRAKYDKEVPPNLIDDSVGVDTTEEAGKLLDKIFEKNKVFEYPKSVSLIEYILQFTNQKNAIVLDSFAGSGTTAHAVLNLNKSDNGSRQFILIEMMDYADSITAERIKRVIKGFSDVPGTEGDFVFCELGASLFNNDGNINEEVEIDKIREYIYFMETKKEITETNDNAFYLGSENQVSYYFFYKKDKSTCLNFDFLSTISNKNQMYVIYADKCTMNEYELEKYNITFKKIPRDITRL